MYVSHVTRVLEVPRFVSRLHIKLDFAINEHFLERHKVSIIKIKQYPWDTQRERYISCHFAMNKKCC